MKRGTRVIVDGDHNKIGTINYVRMAPPNYTVPEAVSVVLDGRRDDHRYQGTLFAADRVSEVVSEPLLPQNLTD